MKTFDDYDRAVARTARLDRYGITDFGQGPTARLWLAEKALGVAGEAGECADIVKKHIRDRTPLDIHHLEEELGDVLCYVSAIAQAIGTSLAEVAARNDAKLRVRYPDGGTFAGIAEAPITICAKGGTGGAGVLTVHTPEPDPTPDLPEFED